MYRDAGRLPLVVNTNGGVLIYNIISEDYTLAAGGQAIKHFTCIFKVEEISLFGKKFTQEFLSGHSLQKPLVKYGVKLTIIYKPILSDFYQISPTK